MSQEGADVWENTRKNKDTLNMKKNHLKQTYIVESGRIKQTQ